MPEKPDFQEDPILRMLREMGESRMTSGTTDASLRQQSAEVNARNSAPVQGTAKIISQKTVGDLNARLSRNDVRDLVTGDTVMNFSVREPVAADALRITPENIDSLSQYYTAGRSVDVRLFIHEIDRAVIPGFLENFTTEERALFQSAPPTLSKKIHYEIMRTFLASRTEDLIHKTSRGIEKRIAPCLPLIKNPRVRKSIETCIEIWRENMQNPYQNFYRRTARVADIDPHLHHEYGPLLSEINPRYFSINIIQGSLDMKNMGAGFSNQSQMMMLREPEGDMDFIEFLAVIHELTHKAYDADAIQQMGVRSSMYRENTKSGPSNVMIGLTDEDPVAIENELQILLTQTGFGKLDVAAIAQKIGVQSERSRKGLVHLLSYAQEYFKTYAAGAIPPHFAAFVESEYRRLGGTILMKDADGRLMKKP